MRISTNMIYELGGTSVGKQQSSLYKLQQQVSSGKRVNTPSDDPLAAARVLDLNQSKSVSEQLSTNANYATSALQAQESALGSVSDLLTKMRTQGVYAGNVSLSQVDRKVLATELRSQYAELLSLVNTQDNGRYLFSGYHGDTQPFSESTPGVVNYNGDEGQRLIQVTPTRQVPVSVAGIELFQRIKNGNGTFAISGNPTITGVTNSGSGVATPGNLLDPTKWDAATIPNQTTAPFSGANPGPGGFRVVFNKDTAVSPSVTTYDIVAISNGTVVNGNTYNAGFSLLTGLTSVTQVDPSTGATVYPATYSQGAAISFSGGPTTSVNSPHTANASTWDLGAEFSVSGEPASGDVFTIRDTVRDQDIFSTVHNLINALENTSGAQLANHVMTFLQDVDQAVESVLTGVTTVGTYLAEVESHKENNEDLVLQYKTEISNLEDLDYATALTELSLRQAGLTASQKSFLAVQGLSLFNYI